MSTIASISQRRVKGFNHISLRPLNDRPLKGRQSSPSFIPRRREFGASRSEQAFSVEEHSGRMPRDDHDAEIGVPLGRSIQKA
jgi:hypothetical protein